MPVAFLLGWQGIREMPLQDKCKTRQKRGPGPAWRVSRLIDSGSLPNGDVSFYLLRTGLGNRELFSPPTIRHSVPYKEQFAKHPHWAERMGWLVFALYEDLACSGYQAMMRTVRNGLVDAIAVVDTDRLHRHVAAQAHGFQGDGPPPANMRSCCTARPGRARRRDRASAGGFI